MYLLVTGHRQTDRMQSTLIMLVIFLKEKKKNIRNGNDDFNQIKC